MISVNYIAIGQRIKEKRKEAGLNQKELAAKIGLSEASVSKYEHGKVEDATHNMLIKFADVLGVSVSWLLGLEEKPKETSSPLSFEEKMLIDKFRKLNRAGKDYIIQTMDIAISVYKDEPFLQKKNA
ncbi:helix-turn-helix transcriptional regulator [Lachnospiraceae bacterium 38-14]